MMRARSQSAVLFAICICAAMSPDLARAQPRQTTGSGKSRGLTFEEARNKMVDEEIVAAGVKNSRVIAAMRATPRHEFVPSGQVRWAYYDMALPIGEGQTISPPFIVAYMTEAIDPQPKDKVLEIGTGSGYQAAVLSGLAQEVYTIEIVEPLGKRAAATLKRLHYDNVHAKVGDGYLGWPEHAPFDKIIVTCSPEKVPQALVDQLKDGGRMIMPVGERYQQTLYLLKKTGGKLVSESLLPTIFVPMTGAAEEKREKKPDPKNPRIVNGDFARLLGDTSQAAGWHYQRQAEVVRDGGPSGVPCMKFHNTESGRGAQALQAFAVDGRYVRQLQVSFHVRYKDVKAGPTPQQLPLLGVIFYDEDRGMIGEKYFGPWRGASDWKGESKKIDVPVRAREAIVRIGLCGATGEISYADIKMAGLP
jgi:protein-L-isoaspartate(D-aspartate) O-methyltransferase